VVEQQQKQQPGRIMTVAATPRAVEAALASGARWWNTTVGNGRVVEFPENVHFEEEENGGYQVFVGAISVGWLYRNAHSCLVPWSFVTPHLLSVVA
jgi:hypothetical protein